MQLIVNGTDIFAATGGQNFDPKLPTVVFLHGAGFNHSAWALHSRWFAHHGFGVLAPDLPGHGRSGGKPLTSIEAMADWTIALLDAAGAARVKLIGHSMGSLIALDACARHASRVNELCLIAASDAMAVSPDLLSASQRSDHDAIDMVSIWGHGFAAEIGGSLAPGLWMHGGAQRTLEAARAGVLHADLSACNAYRNALASARVAAVPVTLILGERDMMTPLKNGRALAAAFANARTVVLKGAGHMMMSERPDEVLAACRGVA
jgi:pimeloyl-ACP methyl ester carboxylesterase